MISTRPPTTEPPTPSKAYMGVGLFAGRQDRLNWETVMINMRKELRYSQGLRKRNLNYLKYYGGTA